MRVVDCYQKLSKRRVRWCKLRLVLLSTKVEKCSSRLCRERGNGFCTAWKPESRPKKQLMVLTIKTKIVISVENINKINIYIRYYYWWCIIYFVVPCSPYPRLIRSTWFNESAIRIPFSLVVVRVVICVRQVSDKKNSLAFRVRHVMIQCLVRGIGLP